jgi:hypothetical protein
MGTALLATATMTILTFFLQKTGEGVAKKIGEDIWGIIKNVFTKKEEIETVRKVEKGQITSTELSEIEKALMEHLKQPEFANTLKENLNITPSNEFRLTNYLNMHKVIQEKLKDYYAESLNAGIGTVGDYKNLIAQQERRLKEVEKMIIEIISNQ